MKRIIFITIYLLLNIAPASLIQAMNLNSTRAMTPEHPLPTIQTQIQTQNQPTNLIPCAGFPRHDSLKSLCLCHNELARYQNESLYPIDLFQDTFLDCICAINNNITSSIENKSISIDSILKTVSLLAALHERTQNNKNFTIRYNNNRQKGYLPYPYVQTVNQIASYLHKSWRPLLKHPGTEQEQALCITQQKQNFQRYIDLQLESLKKIAREKIEREMNSIVWGEPTEHEEQAILEQANASRL